MAHSAASGILNPSGEKNLIPLSRAGLWEAEMTTPSAHARAHVR
jgi:hypothetical protein